MSGFGGRDRAGAVSGGRRELWRVGATQAGTRLDKFLAAPERLGSRGRAAAAIERGKVFVNDTEVSPGDASRSLVADDAVRVWHDRPGSSRPAYRAVAATLDIVFEDASLIVINKPPGVLSVPLASREKTLSVVDLLEDYLRSRTRRRPLVVHRIDRDTSGLVVFAKDVRAQAVLKTQFRKREPERVYWAVVYGHPDPPAGTWRDHLVWDPKALIQKETSARDRRAAEAVAEYRVLERFNDTSLIEVRLHTGKRNQIRVQSRLRGHTLVGEQRYTYGPDALRPIAFPRQALHARALAFKHPVDSRCMRFEAQLPGDFSDLLAQLRRQTRVRSW